jgi:hypothetical protein
VTPREGEPGREPAPPEHADDRQPQWYWSYSETTAVDLGLAERHAAATERPPSDAIPVESRPVESRPVEAPAEAPVEAPPVLAPQPTFQTKPAQAFVERVPTGTVERNQAGKHWFMYRRPPAPRANPWYPQRAAGSAPLPPRHRDVPADPDRGGGGPPPSRGRGGDDDPSDDARSPPPHRSEHEVDDPGSGVLPAALAVIVGATLFAGARWMEAPYFSRVLVPLLGVLIALAFAPAIMRRHRDEPWIAKYLVAGVIFKAVASGIRYRTLVDAYGAVGDATQYDIFGKAAAKAWIAGDPGPVLPDLRKTNFIKWFTGVVYYLFGPDMITGFLVFGLIAVLGSYFWYRATADSIPFLDKRLYLGLVLFLPSVAFWPSSIGKEALMQLGLGVAALAAACILRQRLFQGFLIGAAGGWLLWVVRAHLLAIVTFSLAAAYLFGRSALRTADDRVKVSLARPIGAVILIVVVVFALSQAADFLGMEDFSLNSIEAELDQTSAQTAQGGSKFGGDKDQPRNNSLTPLRLPAGAATVLLRPFPWEIESGFQILASLESMALALLMLRRWSSMKLAVTRSRSSPFLLYCWTMIAIWAATFSSFANFGLLTRQRSLVLPALFVMIAIDPVLASRPATTRTAERELVTAS